MRKAEIAKRYAGMSRLIERSVRLFGCDSARIAKPGETMFLVLGWNRNTAKDREKDPGAGQWVKDGIPYDFDYLHEKAVASGRTEKELLASAKEYKRLLGLTMEEYIREQTAKPKTGRAGKHGRKACRKRND